MPVILLLKLEPLLFGGGRVAAVPLWKPPEAMDALLARGGQLAKGSSSSKLGVDDVPPEFSRASSLAG